MTKSRDEIWDEWRERVNMTPDELEQWFKTEESRSAGDSDDGESTGHLSGWRIAEIRRTGKEDLSDDQWDRMAEVTGYIARHCAQVPDGDVTDTPWRHSLMNWGHDPLKDGGCA